MALRALAAACLAGGAQAQGLASCPCLTSFPAGVTVNSGGTVTATIAGTEHEYPATFGLNNCAAHSSTLPPYAPHCCRPVCTS